MILIKFSIKKLLKLNIQLSISSYRWNNYVKSFIHAKYREFYFINLFKTIFNVRLVAFFLSDLVKKRGKICFIEKRSEFYFLLKFLKFETNQDFVGNYWVSGAFSNFNNFKSNYYKGRINCFLKDSNYYNVLTLPDLVVSFSFYENLNALSEVRCLGIPIISLVGSDVNPSGVDFMLFSNDFSDCSLFLFSQIFRFSIINGLVGEKLNFYKNLRKYCYLYFLKMLLNKSKVLM